MKLAILSAILISIALASQTGEYSMFMKNEKWSQGDVVNNRPIIGVMTLPKENSAPYQSYMMASYVKFLEMSGARVVPVRFNETDEETIDKLKHLNGFLFPGGGTSLIYYNNTISDYTRKGKVVVDFIKQQNDQGIHYPIYSIWLGFEEMAIIEAPYADVLGYFDAENISNNLTFVQNPKDTNLFGGISPSLENNIKNMNLTFNAHIRGISPEMFEKHPELKQSYNIVSVSYDRKGVEYISSFEHKKYPFFGSQFHPEKNSFIWKTDLDVPHSQEAIELGQYISNFFVKQAKMNMNHFADDKTERSLLVENYKNVFTDTLSQDIYLF